ncbi:hypothetical protein [Erwinia aphidicola]
MTAHVKSSVSQDVKKWVHQNYSNIFTTSTCHIYCLHNV